MTDEQLRYWCLEFDCTPEELRWLLREAAAALPEERSEAAEGETLGAPAGEI